MFGPKLQAAALLKIPLWPHAQPTAPQATILGDTWQLTSLQHHLWNLVQRIHVLTT